MSICTVLGAYSRSANLSIFVKQAELKAENDIYHVVLVQIRFAIYYV